jgi:amphi-Trp domain-containing protein
MAMLRKRQRDVERAYPTRKFIEKLHRLADALAAGRAFVIQVAGERVRVPADADISVEHERASDGEELEFQLTWPSRGTARSGARRGRRSTPGRPRSRR